MGCDGGILIGMEAPPSHEDITIARDALSAIEGQDLDLSSEVVARVRGAVQALEWVMGSGPPPTPSSLGG